MTMTLPQQPSRSMFKPSAKSVAARLMIGASSVACLAVATPAAAGVMADVASFDQLAHAASVSPDLAKPSASVAAKTKAITGVAYTLQEVLQPVLSVGLIGSDKTVQRGTPARFLGYSNYAAFVERAELRIFEAGSDIAGSPHVVIPANADGVMEWMPTNYASDKMVAVYRVYDADGSFDETEAQALNVLPAAQVFKPQAVSRPDFGSVDAVRVRNIDVSQAKPAIVAGTLSVDASKLHVEGQLVTHDAANGNFAAVQLVPAHCSAVTVVAQRDCGETQVSLPVSQMAQSAASGDGLAITVNNPGTSDQLPVQERSADDHSIEVRTEGAHVDPVLSVGLVENERVVVRGEQFTFIGYTNYPSLISKAELRLFVSGQTPATTPYAVVPMNGDNIGKWTVDPAAPQDMFYVLRVYDEKGKFDETRPEELTVLDVDPDPQSAPARSNFGSEDMASIRTIRMRGVSKVTVTGQADPDRDIVRVAGQYVPVDDTGFFVSEQIVRDGTPSIAIQIGEGENVSFAAVRDLKDTNEKWFVVGQGEVTLGKSFSKGPATQVSGDTLAEGSFAAGRAAFYAKGKIDSDWRVTASLDTGEALVKDLFSNLDRKDPRQLLRRLNSEQYYPTYGDDSTLVEDAPTQGRFYLRVDNGISQAVLGNFIAQANGAELAQLDRGLFGALLDLNSEGTTSFGERKAQVLGFASDPGTVPAREEFRGTGGSLYFLQRQDVSIGSERVRIEIRDRETGIVLESEELHPREDYDFDPFNGRLTLLKPLSSTADSGRTVRDGSASGNIPVLVVRYEYSPTFGDLDGYTVGGRGTVWLGDKLRIGATAQRDTVEEADQTLLGADAMLRLTAGTYVKAEFAQTEGVGFSQANSVDGGLTFADIANPGVANQTAQAWRTEVAVNVAELAKKQGDLGQFSAFYEQMDQGFSSAGRLTQTDTTRWGVAANIPLGDTGKLVASYDEFDAEGRGGNRTGEIDLSNRFTLSGGTLTASAGVRHEDLTPGNLFNSTQDGARTDSAVELEYQPAGKNWTVHAFGQATLDNDTGRQTNNRAGGGLTAQLTDRLSLKGEVSGGDGGLGADVLLNHRTSEGSESYVGYSLLADRTDTGLDSQNFFTDRRGGSLVVGSRQRFSDSLSVFGENRVGVGGEAASLSRSFGLQFNPTEKVSVSGTFENGRIDDPQTGEFRRTAGSLSFGYTGKDFRAGTAVEVRREDGALVDQTVWLVRSNLSYAVNPDWRFVGEVNLARADNEGTNIRAAEFTEAIGGFAYRPIDNDRVNGLIRLHYFEDLGPVGQITGSGQTESPKQVSTIFSADFNFDLSDRLTLGTKYGYRSGRVSLARNSDEFVSSNAHLGVIRLDYNVIREWDVMAEGRALWADQADDLRLGALAGIYRHVGDHVKIGVGYSWSDFSDDLTDQSYSSHGPFLNLLGRF
jgi:hypothetical protein